MNSPAGTPTTRNPFLEYGQTHSGMVLVNIRFWVATLIGLALLIGGYVATANGAGLAPMFVWLTFSVLWLVWALIVRMSQGFGTAGLAIPVAQPAPTTHHQTGRGPHNITPLTPEQRAWVEKQKAKAPAEPVEDFTPEQLGAIAATIADRQAMTKKPTKAKAKAEPPRSAAPEPHPLGVDHEGAEHLAAQWMRHLRVLDAETTRHVMDDGIDVDSAHFVAQVKHLTGGVGGPDLHRLAGVASVAGKHGVFFANTYYTAQAILFAERAKVALFRYDAHAGTLHGENPLAQKAIDSGDLNAAFRP
ncbi:restriction endonuclease [Microbacterium sp. A196]|uniref:restriction endonuclease n=1 Tax=Microbacterium sp. A196 TaxID=3457320 RepID=UPI003FD45164